MKIRETEVKTQKTKIMGVLFFIYGIGIITGIILVLWLQAEGV